MMRNRNYCADAEDAELRAILFCCAQDAQICAYKKTCCVGNPNLMALSKARPFQKLYVLYALYIDINLILNIL